MIIIRVGTDRLHWEGFNKQETNPRPTAHGKPMMRENSPMWPKTHFQLRDGEDGLKIRPT